MSSHQTKIHETFLFFVYTLQGNNISHLGKRKIIDSKVPLKGFSSQEGICFLSHFSASKFSETRNQEKRSMVQSAFVRDMLVPRSVLGRPRKLGSMVRINGLFHLLLAGVYWGEITHFLTFCYPSSHNHGSGKWVPPIVVTFKLV